MLLPRNFRCLLAITVVCTLWPAIGSAELMGEVDTAFRWLGKDDRVIVEAYDDPKVHGITCYVSRARTGGFKGAVGVAEDRSEASIACRQAGESLHFTEKLPQQEDVFTERMSILFKRLHIVRIIDLRRNVLIYLTYSDRLIEEVRKIPSLPYLFRAVLLYPSNKLPPGISSQWRSIRALLPQQ